MKYQILKIIKSSLIGFIVLALCAAPAFQAVQISNTVEQMSQACKCCCCSTDIEEQTCAARSYQKDARCGCEVGQSLPLNSAPIVSNSQNDNQHKFATNIEQQSNAIFSDCNNTYKLVLSDHLPKKHPPLFVLNSSFLI